MRTVLRRAALGSVVMGAGLALRGYGAAIGLPFPLVKYGGSILWGTMVFFLVGMLASPSSRRAGALVALLIAIAVELFRLWHTPVLDAFRLTPTGALLLGRVFSPWNIIAYAAELHSACCSIAFGRRQIRREPDNINGRSGYRLF